MTVEPVVVIPDMASKKASVKLSSSSENTKGIDANRVRAIQLNVVMTKACFTDRRSPPARDVRVMAPPTKRVTPEDMANTCQSGLPMKASTMAGTIMPSARADNRMPMTRNMGR